VPFLFYPGGAKKIICRSCCKCQTPTINCDSVYIIRTMYIPFCLGDVYTLYAFLRTVYTLSRNILDSVYTVLDLRRCIQCTSKYRTMYILYAPLPLCYVQYGNLLNMGGKPVLSEAFSHARYKSVIYPRARFAKDFNLLTTSRKDTHRQGLGVD
jgi:hypothetical protein